MGVLSIIINYYDKKTEMDILFSKELKQNKKLIENDRIMSERANSKIVLRKKVMKKESQKIDEMLYRRH